MAWKVIFEADALGGEPLFHDSQQGRVGDKAPLPLVVVLEYLSTRGHANANDITGSRTSRPV